MSEVFQELAIQASEKLAKVSKWDQEMLEAHQDKTFDKFSELRPDEPPISNALEGLRDLINEAIKQRGLLLERAMDSDLNDRQIARMSGVAHTTIARRRKKEGLDG